MLSSAKFLLFAKELGKRGIVEEAIEVAKYLAKKTGRTLAERMAKVRLPSEGEITYTPPPWWRPNQRLPRGKQYGYRDVYNNEWVKGPSRIPGEPFEWDVQLSAYGKKLWGHLSRDGRHINVSLRGKITH